MAAVAIAAAFAACGGPAPEERARTTVEDLQRAFADGDFRAACNLMSDAAREHLGRSAHGSDARCPRDLRSLAAGLATQPGAADDRRPVVAGLELRGSRAVATLRLGRGAVSHVPLVKERGAWKVDALWGDIPGARQPDRF